MATSVNFRSGFVEIISGPMFSGKTTLLLERYREYSPKDTLVVKYLADDRYAKNAIVTHNGDKIVADFNISTEQMGGLCDEIRRWHRSKPIAAVFVDEGHFFGEKLIDFIDDLAMAGIRVHVATLLTDVTRNPFPGIPTVMARAEKMVKLDGPICDDCKAVAGCFNIRKDPKLNAIKDFVIGGCDIYLTVCRDCWYKRQ